MLAAQDTGRVLLIQRSRKCSEPLTWAIPGGKIDRGETARTAAARELEEEVGWDGTLVVMRKPVFVFERPGLKFLTFFGHVEVEFEPQLNWESAAAGWFSLSKLPCPLHPGVEELVYDAGAMLIDEIRRVVWRS